MTKKTLHLKKKTQRTRDNEERRLKPLSRYERRGLEMLERERPLTLEEQYKRDMDFRINKYLRTKELGAPNSIVEAYREEALWTYEQWLQYRLQWEVFTEKTVKEGRIIPFEVWSPDDEWTDEELRKDHEEFFGKPENA